MGVLERVCLALRDVNSPRQIHVFLSRQKEDCLELFVCQAPESVSYHLAWTRRPPLGGLLALARRRPCGPTRGAALATALLQISTRSLGLCRSCAESETRRFCSCELWSLLGLRIISVLSVLVGLLISGLSTAGHKQASIGRGRAGVSR